MEVVMAMVAFRILTASERHFGRRESELPKHFQARKVEVTKRGVGNVWAKDSFSWYGSSWDHKSDNDTETEGGK